MRIDHLSIDDFRSYGHADVDLTGLQLASIVGENGAGKSTIMDSAVFALTGARTRGNLDDWIRDFQEECRVSCVFAPSANGHRYRVTRTRSRRNSGKSTAELCREEGGLWVADCTGAKDVDARIRDLIGADEELLLMTSFISQDEAKRFLELTPSKRLEVLGQILKLDEQYEPVEKHWKEKTVEAKADLEDARREISRLTEDVLTLAGRQDELEAAQAEWTASHARLTDAEKALQEARERARAAERDAQRVQDARRRLEDLRARQSELRLRKQTRERETQFALPDAAALERQLATRPDVEAQLAVLAESERADAETRQRRAVLDAQLHGTKQAILETSTQGKPKAAELERLRSQATDLNDRVCAIRGAEQPECDRCGQKIADKALKKTLEQLEVELETVAVRRNAVGLEVEDLRRKLAEQKAEAEKTEAEISALPALNYDLAEDRRLKALFEQLNQIPAKLAEIAGLAEMRERALRELEEAAEALRDPVFVQSLLDAEREAAEADERGRAVAGWQSSERAAESTYKDQLASTAETERTIARHEEAIKLLAPSRDQLTVCQQRSRELEEDQADAELLRKAFSKWGIPALIVGNVLLALEREVNELMALYEGGMVVRFESTKETRDGARDSLEIIIDRAGASRAYETYSGGEKYRIASCIRLGLALLMAHRAGARIGTLILDEPEGLDAEGRLHLVKILEHLSAQFERILLISHHDDLKDAMPSQVVVSRGEDGLSRVEVSA